MRLICRSYNQPTRPEKISRMLRFLIRFIPFWILRHSISRIFHSHLLPHFQAILIHRFSIMSHKSPLTNLSIFPWTHTLLYLKMLKLRSWLSLTDNSWHDFLASQFLGSVRLRHLFDWRLEVFFSWISLVKISFFATSVEDLLEGRVGCELEILKVLSTCCELLRFLAFPFWFHGHHS